MANVTIQNTTATTLNVVIIPDANFPSQAVLGIAAAGTLILDSVVYSQSPDIYKKVSEGKLIVTAGSAPDQVVDPAKISVIPNLAASYAEPQ